MIRAPRAGAFIAAVATGLLAVGTMGPAVATADIAPNVVVVDDDGLQCPEADVDSVQEALDRVRLGGHVRVCPGRYAEQLTISRPVHLQGEIGSVASFACLDPAPKQSDDIDPTRFAILEPDPAHPTAETTPLRIEADDVEVAGLVVQGMTDDTPEHPTPTVSLYDAAIAVTDAASRARLHHNLVRDNTFGIELGGPQSRVDHNCLRDNDFAIANQRYHLVGARIDDNTTFRTTILPFEIGWTYAGTTDVQIDHNVSVENLPQRVHWVEYAVRPRIEANEVKAARSGVVLRLSSGAVVSGNEISAGVSGIAVTRNTDGEVTDNRVTTAGQGVTLGGGNADVVVARNHVTGTASGGTSGIMLIPPAPAPVNDGITIEDNTVSGLHGSPGSGVVVGTGSVLPGSVVRRNVVSGNPGDGIVLAANVDGLLLAGNIASGNRGDGIRLEPGASENALEDNVALGNGSTDAKDLSLGAGAVVVLNHWVRTTCVTDVPLGLICVPQATTVSP